MLIIDIVHIRLIRFIRLRPRINCCGKQSLPINKDVSELEHWIT